MMLAAVRALVEQEPVVEDYSKFKYVPLGSCRWDPIAIKSQNCSNYMLSYRVPRTFVNNLTWQKKQMKMTLSRRNLALT